MQTEQKIISINPQKAKDYLQNNTDNRSAAKKHIKFLAEQMTLGKWKYTGDPIKISSTGRILDGQHRLMAIIESGTTQHISVVTGLDDAVFDVLDTGKPRSAGDVLMTSGIVNYTAMAALVKMIIRFNTGQYTGILDGASGVRQASFSNSEILEFAQNNDLREYYQFGVQCYQKIKLLSRTEYAFLFYIFSKKDIESAEVFFNKLTLGIDLSMSDPVLYLRNKLLNSMGKVEKMNARSRFILIVKCWNLFRKSKTALKIHISPEEKVPEII